MSELPETSASRPITVSWILTSKADTDISAPGRLGLCFCPGKQHARGGRLLCRDLHADLVRLREAYHISCVVCLLNDAELRSYNLRDYASSVAAQGLDYVQHPIIECAAPDDFAATTLFLDDLAERLGKGQVMALHCRGGVGRAGMIAACVLLRLGHAASASDAIKQVRRLRCKTAVETRRQEDFVADYSRHVALQQMPGHG